MTKAAYIMEKLANEAFIREFNKFLNLFKYDITALRVVDKAKHLEYHDAMAKKIINNMLPEQQQAHLATWENTKKWAEGMNVKKEQLLKQELRANLGMETHGISPKHQYTQFLSSKYAPSSEGFRIDGGKVKMDYPDRNY